MSKRTLAAAAASSSSSGSAPTSSGSIAASAPEPSKRPRHFHAGLSSRTQQAEEEKQSDAPLPSPIRRLHRHALESVFGFLSLKGLSVIAQVCQTWSAAMLSMAPMRSAVTVADAPSFTSSRLLCAHVATCVIKAKLTRSALNLITSLAPHLTDVSCTIHSSSTLGISLPRKLKRLEMCLLSDRFNDAPQCVHDVLAAMAQLPLESLEFTWPASSEVSLAGLSAVRSLRTLKINFYERGDQLTAKQLDEIRALPWLSSVQIEAINEDSLRHLLRALHQLQWTRLAPLDALREAYEAADGVATLPLTSIVFCMWDDPVLWLPRFAYSLHDLKLDSLGVLDEAGLARLCVDLCSLVHLTRLALGYIGIDDAQMTLIMQSMPALRHLELYQMFSLESLLFLSVAGAPKLESLVLEGGWSGEIEPDSGELSHIVRSQKQLRSLRIRDLWTLNSLELIHFEVPSLTMPELVKFSYEPREQDPRAANEPDEEGGVDDGVLEGAEAEAEAAEDEGQHEPEDA